MVLIVDVGVCGLGRGTTFRVFPNSKPLLDRGGSGDLTVTWAFMTPASFISGGTVALQPGDVGGQS